MWFTIIYLLQAWGKTCSVAKETTRIVEFYKTATDLNPKLPESILLVTMRVIKKTVDGNDKSVWAAKKTNKVTDKTNKVTVRPAKTKISLGIRPVWSESSLCA